MSMFFFIYNQILQMGISLKNNSTLYQNAVFWLVDERGIFFTNSSFFQLFHQCRDICLKISRYYRKISRSRRNPFFKWFMTSWMLFELLGFLLSTNAKVKKMTTVSAVMFEIVEMYIFQIHLHYFCLACCMLKQNRDWFYFWICSRMYTLVTSLKRFFLFS